MFINISEYAGYQRHINGHPVWAGPHYIVTSLDDCMEDCTANVYCVGTFYSISESRCFHLLTYDIDQWSTSSNYVTYIKGLYNATLNLIIKID